MLLLALACAEAPAPPLPSATVATGVSAEGPGWAASASTLTLAGAEARAAEVAVARTAEGRPPLQITAARSTWDLRARSARFEGDVVVTRGDVELRCAALDVRYADAERVDRVIATGGVTVRRGGRLATAAQADLEGATGKVTLTGDPTLAEGPNALAGRVITLFLDDERATCEGDGGAPCRLVVDGSALGR